MHDWPGLEIRTLNFESECTRQSMPPLTALPRAHSQGMSGYITLQRLLACEMIILHDHFSRSLECLKQKNSVSIHRNIFLNGVKTVVL